MSRQYLHGRIFDRALQFATLSPEAQEETKACEQYLIEHKDEVFRMHHASPFRTVYSVRGKQLVEVIDTWLKEHPRVVQVEPITSGLEINPVQEDRSPINLEVGDPVQEDRPPTDLDVGDSVQVDRLPTDPEEEDRPPTDPEEEDRPPTAPETGDLEDGLPADPEINDFELSNPNVSSEDHPLGDPINPPVDASTPLPQPIVEAIPSTIPHPQPATSTHPQPSTMVVESLDELKNRRFHAKELMVAMLCHGFLALHKEWHSEYVYKDFDLYIPISPELKKDSNIFIWEAIENAIFAAPMKRKIGLFTPLTHGKEHFIVIKEKRILIYENDTIPSRPLVELDLDTISLTVAYDTSVFPFGIKVWNKELTEVFNPRDGMEQDWLMYALVSTGIEYSEPLPSITSLYTIKETTLQGETVDFNTLKGRVVLIVNVASEDPSSTVQYTELMDLYEKYKEDGLIIIGMPCTQFGNCEFNTSLNILEYVQNIGINFILLEQGHVNGLNTRPLFGYLKSILRGPHGIFIDWNFTKFLVDRYGIPVRRFEPEETPLMFEDVIVELLSQVPPLEVMDEKVTALNVATQVVESVGEAMLAKEGIEEEVEMVNKSFEVWNEDETNPSSKQMNGEMNEELGPRAVFS